MTRIARPSLLFPALSLFAACGTAADSTIVQSSKQRETAPAVSQQQLTSAAASERGFGVDLYKQLIVNKQNLFFSPHSISSALLMTYAGAANGTASEMRSTLELSLPDAQVHVAANALDLALESRGQGQSGQDGQPFRLRVANAIWGQTGESFLAGFLDTLAVDYGAGMNVVDFMANAEGARTTINDWVAQKTEDKVKDLLPPGTVDGSTRLVLTNAVYYNAAWAEPFEASTTTSAPFHTLDGTDVSAPTMRRGFTGTSYYKEGDDGGTGLQAVAVPYAGHELSMVIIAPAQLQSFEASLTPARLDQILTGLAPQAVDLSLPKWQLTDESPLRAPLQALGMQAAFTAGEADFSAIDGGRDLVVSEVLHKAYVSVDEKGTEAAAATAVVVGETSVPLYTEMKVDRPFIYLIRDDATGAIVFMGRVVDPTL